MLKVSALLVLLGGGLSAYWVWSLHQASEDLKKYLAIQLPEFDRLKSASALSNAASGQVRLSLTQELQSRRSELLQREKLVQDWQRGLFRPGLGHAAWLQLIAQSIPVNVWVIQVRVDDGQFEVGGFTFEPGALSEWVAKLSASPLLKGQSLSTVKLESVNPVISKAVGGMPRPLWSFSLLSVIATSSAATGGKP